ncbi:adhesin [Escherichia coli]|uniref:fimbrial protein n=1 Tax=Escherichia coli TaxID=562 RepID=UPI0005419566|nr:fimbrial protein [Escherichia coli]EFN8610100.1 adhesin [Escherichia coli O83:H28]EEV5877073.1 adhesin [Escherichia coli]EEV6163978.1 adhesin [Escherichia coli]EEV8855696.1 adhesin [Escherichia coli]EEW1609602.1 adhesin [Escherichia coli]
MQYILRILLFIISLFYYGLAAGAFNITFVGNTEQTISSASTYSLTHAMDNLPYVLDEVGTSIGYSASTVWQYPRGVRVCAGLDAKVDLPVVGSINGQSIYGVTNEIGLLVWMGSAGYSDDVAMTGNVWANVLDSWCTINTPPASQGLSLYVKPVILKRSATTSYIIPQTTIGSIKFRPEQGPVSGYETTVNFTLNSFTVNNTVTSCKLLTPSSVNVVLQDVYARQFPSSGDEVVAGSTTLRLQCDAGVTVWATLTDATTPSNRSDILTLTGSSTATGVGLRIYKNTDSRPLKFGPDSPVKGNENQWQLSTGTETSPSVRLYVKYVNTGEGINPGTVNGISTFTFSYQ